MSSAQQQLGENLRFAEGLKHGDEINYVTKRGKLKQVTVKADASKKQTKKGERVVLSLATKARPNVPWTAYVEPDKVFELAA